MGSATSLVFHKNDGPVLLLRCQNLSRNSDDRIGALARLEDRLHVHHNQSRRHPCLSLVLCRDVSYFPEDSVLRDPPVCTTFVVADQVELLISLSFCRLHQMDVVIAIDLAEGDVTFLLVGNTGRDGHKITTLDPRLHRVSFWTKTRCLSRLQLFNVKLPVHR